jgi:hypothetical protein
MCWIGCIASVKHSLRTGQAAQTRNGSSALGKPNRLDGVT